MILEKEKTVVLSLGGSLIVPDEIDWEFIKNFKTLIRNQIEKSNQFIIVTGGGKTARKYIEAAEKSGSVSKDDKDWMGIHATRMNAHLIRTIFSDLAHPRINTNPHDLEDFYVSQSPILVAAGWRPGNSTDLIAVMLAKYLSITKVVNLSNIDYVYDKDPRQNPDAKKIENINWNDFCQIVGSRWDPGMNVPFDPVASQLAREEEIEVAIMNGKNLENLKSYIEGKEFKGTMIK